MVVMATGIWGLNILCGCGLSTTRTYEVSRLFLMVYVTVCAVIHTIFNEEEQLNFYNRC